MNIRCERCSTTYDLDESLLAPEGSPVQCTKCQHVFTAVPPRTAGRTLIGVAAAPAPNAPAPPRAPTAAQPSSPSSPPATERKGPAIYRPTPGHAPSAVGARVAPKPRRDTMGAMEKRLQTSARLRWVVPVLIVTVLAGAAGAWLLLRKRTDPTLERRRGEAMALVSLDDIESLEKASQLLEELGRQDEALDSVDADRALAQLLLSTGLLEEAASLAPEGEAARAQAEARAAEARTLAERAKGTLKQMASERGTELAVARALAIHYAAAGDREMALRNVKAARKVLDRDPWAQLAEGWLDAREETKEARERAATALAALAKARPEAVRARFLLARVQALLGKREAAAATLDGLLAVNPRHRRASRLKAELVAAPAPAPAVAPGVAPGPVAPQAAIPAPVPQRPWVAPAPAQPQVVRPPLPAPAAAPAPKPAPAPATVAAPAPKAETAAPQPAPAPVPPPPAAPEATPAAQPPGPVAPAP